MQIIRTIQALRTELSRVTSKGMGPIGFVPTMGYLHEGHGSLLERARMECGTVVLSIFVNPIQFGPGEDFETYPRDEARDLHIAEEKGVDIAFLPTMEEMYPQPVKTKVAVSELTTLLCGASRPGHFDGVTTVVNKLFNIVKPHYAYFGMKDAQQVAVIQQMVTDLNLEVQVIPCPIVREQDGLAMSSRNVYLSPEERRQALSLSQALSTALEGITKGSLRTAPEVQEHLRSVISKAPLAQIDYAEVLLFPQLQAVSDDATLSSLSETVILAVAVKFGKTRLIDNVLYQPKAGV
ncbi:pantoate--beta-alanine ligase [Paenibacillus sp. F411]|uniref:pantoate--beta-alanine ligase n=1 Tax=unclassified Paenibacillus TaxID=185978 RepID=UPI001AAE1AA2|nr:pantoate--beta-alanine ligase [Paenibacillus sp. F411]MBO2943147.1 pantoate--beta-alanine ligase [Paenibacillus sp. F411]